MTPEQFTAKWRGCTRTERSASQEHFLDLCNLLDVPGPQDEDRHGDFYTFEKNVLKLDGRRGRADVWRSPFTTLAIAETSDTRRQENAKRTLHRNFESSPLATNQTEKSRRIGTVGEGKTSTV
jgi:hypothetical protein